MKELLLEAARTLDAHADGFAYPSKLADRLRAAAESLRPEEGTRNDGIDAAIELIDRMYRDTDNLIEPTRIKMALRTLRRSPMNNGGD